MDSNVTPPSGGRSKSQPVPLTRHSSSGAFLSSLPSPHFFPTLHFLRSIFPTAAIPFTTDRCQACSACSSLPLLLFLSLFFFLRPFSPLLARSPHIDLFLFSLSAQIRLAFLTAISSYFFNRQSQRTRANSIANRARHVRALNCHDGEVSPQFEARAAEFCLKLLGRRGIGASGAACGGMSRIGSAGFAASSVAPLLSASASAAASLSLLQSSDRSHLQARRDSCAVMHDRLREQACDGPARHTAQSAISDSPPRCIPPLSDPPHLTRMSNRLIAHSFALASLIILSCSSCPLLCCRRRNDADAAAACGRLCCSRGTVE